MGFISRKHLSRRTFLRGAGVTMALPLLESMLPAATPLAQTAAAAPTRFAAIYMPHGAILEKWTPASDAPGFEFSEILQPLEPFRNDVNIISHMSHPMAYGGGSATANHNRSAASFLSGAHAQAGSQAYLGITMDQVAAQRIGQDTPLPSLEMMLEGPSLNCEGLSCAYRNTISWQGPTSPLPMQNNPRVVFERLFGEGSTPEERTSRRQQSLSLLDSVMGEVASLQQDLPAADRVRLDRYLTDVREVERRIQKAAQLVTPDIDLPERPAGAPANFVDHINLMFDLQILAWQTDMTRIATLLVAKELSNATYPASGVRDAFHILSHHSQIQENKDRFAVLNRYHVGVFASFLEKLKAMPDGDGNLLDHSLILYGSAMGDGNEHDHTDLPLILAGHASGRLQGGRHIKTVMGTTMSNLLLAMLDKLDIHLDSFGDSTEMMSI